jgi:hypothetical protein
MTSPAPKRCRYDFTLDQKRKICVFYEEQIAENGKLTHADVAEN